MKMIILENKWLYLFLAAIPFAFASEYAWNDVATFVLCMLSIVPLSKLLGAGTSVHICVSDSQRFVLFG